MATTYEDKCTPCLTSSRLTIALLLPGPIKINFDYDSYGANKQIYRFDWLYYFHCCNVFLSNMLFFLFQRTFFFEGMEGKDMKNEIYKSV